MSRREEVDRMIRRTVYDQLYEASFRSPEFAAALKLIGLDHIPIRAAARISQDRYRMKELQDIMDWKKGPKQL